MPTKRASIDEIQGAIDNFIKGLPSQQKQLFDKVVSMLSDLSLDPDGYIKPTIYNLKLITKVKNELDAVVSSNKYQGKVEDLNDVISKVSQAQTLYYQNAFSDFDKPGAVNQLEKISFDSTVDQLAGVGIQENVVNSAADIIEQHIRDGSSFTDLVDQLQVNLLGNKDVDPKLISYSKQVINDTLSGFARNYHAIVTDDLDLEWYTYLGALVDTSRPFCKALVRKKYIHKSELSKIARGNIDGQQVSLQGLMPDTNGDNIISRCGGYNCSHQMIPVASSAVPMSLRKKFEKKNKSDIELD